MANDYFIVLDEAPIRDNPGAKYDLMLGDPESAIGTHVASAEDIPTLLRKVSPDESVYYTCLQRTEGREDSFVLKAPGESLEMACLRLLSQDVLDAARASNANSLANAVSQTAETLALVEKWLGKDIGTQKMWAEIEEGQEDGPRP